MKINIILASVLLLNLPVGAVTLSTNFTNLQGVDSKDTNVVFSDNTGAVISQGSGYVGIGTFAITNGEIAALSASSSLSAAFFQFGSNSDFNITDGAFQQTASSDPDDLFDGVNSYTGRSVYVVIGNAATLADSTEFLVWDSGISFDNTPPSGSPSLIALDVDSGILLIGRNNKDTFDMSGFGGASAEVAFTTVALVPEPSSTALLGLGGVALLLRRRR